MCVIAGGSDGKAPWEAAKLPALRMRLGESALANVAIRLLTRGSKTTLVSYGAKWVQFQNWCDAEGHIALPATSVTCALYVAYLASKGTVQASSLQPYLSAINRVHKDVMQVEEGPAMGYLITRLRHGLAWEQSQTMPERDDVRVALPAAVAVDAIRAGLKASAPVDLQSAKYLRSLTITAFGFMMMGRADTTVHLECTNTAFGDIWWDDDTLYVTLRHEKGRSRKANYGMRTLEFDAPPIRPLLELLTKWQSCHAQWGHPSMYFGLRGESTSTPSAHLTAWLQHACAFLSAFPPEGCTWTSHSLRKGGASAASCIGVPKEKICHYGGWAQTSVAMRQYISPAVQPSAGAWFFFGSLAPSAPPANLHPGRLFSF